MKRYITFFLALQLFISLCMAQSWQRVQLMAPLPNQGPILFDGVAFNDTCVVAEGSGCFITTTDFFQSFNVDTTYKGQMLQALSFPNKNVGYVTSTYAQGGMLTTTDGGNTWNQLTGGNIVNSPGDILFFSNPDTGYVASASISGRFTHTWDGGLIWADSTILNLECPSIFRIQFTNDSTGYILSSDNPNPFDGNFGQLHIFKSTDYGQDWQDITLFDYPAYPMGIGDILFTDDTTAIVVIKNVILKSVDGGYSFDTVMISTYPYDYLGPGMHAISFANHDTGFLAYPENVYKTYDGGNTWTRTDFALDSSDYYNGNGIYFIKAGSTEKAIVGCRMGAIYKTETGGGVYLGVTELKPVTNFLLYPNPTNNILEIAIQNPASNSLQVIVMDISGQTIIHQTINPTIKGMLDVSALPAGLYFIQLQDGQQNMVRKFVKE